MRDRPRKYDPDGARTPAAAELVAGVISGGFSPCSLQKWSCDRVANRLVPSAMRLVTGTANPRPSAVLVVAGASPLVGLTPSPVGMTPLSLWQVGPAPRLIKFCQKNNNNYSNS